MIFRSIQRIVNAHFIDKCNIDFKNGYKQHFYIYIFASQYCKHFLPFMDFEKQKIKNYSKGQHTSRWWVCVCVCMHEIDEKCFVSFFFFLSTKSTANEMHEKKNDNFNHSWVHQCQHTKMIHVITMYVFQKDSNCFIQLNIFLSNIEAIDENNQIKFNNVWRSEPNKNLLHLINWTFKFYCTAYWFNIE